MQQKNWWRNAVIYQIYPRSFYDANDDGDGDLLGVIRKLPYLQTLGVDAIWLSPFYPSPLADGGYDVSDYQNVDPRFGTLQTFERLVACAHELGLRVIIDIVPNHSSNMHPWFQQALKKGPYSYAASRYIFHRGIGKRGQLPPTNWLSVFGGSAWELCGDGWYYLHLFAKEQPDFNWNNQSVREEFKHILRFWCEKGVDGFRVDVSCGLVKDLQEPLRDRDEPTVMSPQSSNGSDPIWDRNKVHAIYRSWRRIFNEYEPPKYAIGEAWSPTTHRVKLYARQDELGAVFDFSLVKASWNAIEYQTCIQRMISEAQSVGSSPSWVLGSHDVPRIASRLGIPRGANVEDWVTSNGLHPKINEVTAAQRARAAALIILGLPGTAFIYQGDELGLPEDLELRPDEIQDPHWERSQHRFKGRDGCRVPLPWSGTQSSFGFNQTGNSWLPQPVWFASYTVEQELNVPDSSLRLYQNALRLRKQWVAHSRSSVEWLACEQYPNMLCWRLTSGMIVVVNFSSNEVIPHHVIDTTVGKSTQLLLASQKLSATHEWVVPPNTAVWLV